MFADYVARFSDNLEALRDFIGLVAPFLAREKDEPIQIERVNLLPLALLLEKADIDISFSDEAKKAMENAAEISIDEILEVKRTDTSEGFRLGVTCSTKRASEAVGKAMKDLSTATEKIRRGRYQEELLYRSALVSLVSATELFLSELLHTYFGKFPESGGVRDKQLSLTEITTLGSIEDAIQYLLNSRVEELLRGSFNDWISFFKSQLKLNMGYLESHKHTLEEICQRRNLIVHNGGIVNAVYLSKVATQFREGLSVSDRLGISKGYLDSAISLFERSFILICAELWKQIAPDDEERADVLGRITYQHLIVERWEVAESFSYFTMKDMRMPEQNRLTATANYWQSLKWQGRFDEIKEEVEAADYSAKSEIFQLARVALLERESEFLEILPRCLKNGTLSPESVKEWPIFREMRQTPTYRKTYGRRKQFK